MGLFEDRLAKDQADPEARAYIEEAKAELGAARFAVAFPSGVVASSLVAGSFTNCAASGKTIEFDAPSTVLFAPGNLTRAQMRVMAFLADFASVAEGKLMVVGGGVSIIGGPFAIGGLVKVSWDEANRPHTLKLVLEDSDGKPAPTASEPLVMEQEFTVGRPPQVIPGSDLELPFALFFAPLPLVPGARYRFRFEIDGQSSRDWDIPFSTGKAGRTQAL